MTIGGLVWPAVCAIALSEIAGRGRVVYTRLISLGSVYVVCTLAAASGSPGGFANLPAVLAILCSGVPLMAAWLGFRIHLSNSITLEMAGLLEDRVPRTLPEILETYDVEAHAAQRIAILQDAGYLAPGPDGRLVDSLKSRAVLWLIAGLCGPDGPRLVASRLRREPDVMR